MDLLELVNQRHSVRDYLDKAIELEKVQLINDYLEKINRENNLNFQLVCEAKGVFDTIMSKLAGWKQMPPAYFALVAPIREGIEEECGYFGEMVVLYCQSLGLNTCWVGGYNKKNAHPVINEGERLVITIAVGYGKEAGKGHKKNKKYEDVCDVTNPPEWFKQGVDCALKAPTAIHQQKFFISLKDNQPIIEAKGKGPFIKLDVGIVKYHFEIGSKVKMK